MTGGLDPDTVHKHGVELSLDRFLGSTVGKIGDRAISVKEIILHVAHVVGGIHRYDAKDDYDKVIEALTSEFPGATLFLLDALRSIARITMRALEPLRDAILQAERFVSDRGATLQLQLRAWELGDDASVHVLQVGGDPSLRLTIDHHGHARLVARGPVPVRLVLDGPRVPIGMPVWVAAELGVDERDVAMRVRVGEIEQFRVFRGAAPAASWATLAADPVYMILGNSTVGAFDVFTWAVTPGFQTRDPARDLAAWARNKGLPEHCVRFTPGKCMTTKAAQGAVRGEELPAMLRRE